jgi:hypothetical protein
VYHRIDKVVLVLIVLTYIILFSIVFFRYLIRFYFILFSINKIENEKKETCTQVNDWLRCCTFKVAGNISSFSLLLDVFCCHQSTRFSSELSVG